MHALQCNPQLTHVHDVCVAIHLNHERVASKHGRRDVLQASNARQDAGEVPLQRNAQTRYNKRSSTQPGSGYGCCELAARMTQRRACIKSMSAVSVKSNVLHTLYTSAPAASSARNVVPPASSKHDSARSQQQLLPPYHTGGHERGQVCQRVSLPSVVKARSHATPIPSQRSGVSAGRQQLL